MIQNPERKEKPSLAVALPSAPGADGRNESDTGPASWTQQCGFCWEKLFPVSLSLFPSMNLLFQPRFPADSVNTALVASPCVLTVFLCPDAVCSLSSLSAFEFSFTRSNSSSRPFVKPSLSFSASEIFNHLSPPSLHSSKFRRQLAGLVYHQGF